MRPPSSKTRTRPRDRARGRSRASRVTRAPLDFRSTGDDSDAAFASDDDARTRTTRRVELKAGATVVLAGGAVLTPHLLHVSGVGAAATLDRSGARLVVENDAVGVGLMDHPAVGVVFDVDRPARELGQEVDLEDLVRVRQVAPALTADMAGLYGRFLNWTRGQPFGSYSRAFGCVRERDVDPPGLSRARGLSVTSCETRRRDAQVSGLLRGGLPP